MTYDRNIVLAVQADVRKRAEPIIGYEAAVAAPFFDPHDCAKAAVAAAIQARRDAWSRRRLGDENGYAKGIDRARWYAARARIWLNMIEWTEMEALDG